MSASNSPFEVRAIRDGEQERFLAHMCECFHLDMDGARPIFYADPFYDITHKRALFDATSGEMISSLTLVPTAIRVTGGALIPAAGIAGVCTTPAFRRQGFAKRLMRATIQSIPTELGYAVAALSTDRPDIYRSVGFETCSSIVHWSAHRKLLPAYPESATGAQTSLKESEGLCKEIQHLYEYAHGTQPGIFARSEARWKTIETSLADEIVVTWRNAGRLEGSAICRKKLVRGENTLEILELLASSAAARRGLIGCIYTMQDVDLVSGQMRATDLRKLGLADLPRFTSYRRDGVMLAILDFDACLSLVAATGILTPVVRRSESGLTIRLENTLSAKDRKPLRLFSVSDDRLGVAIGMSPADEMTGDWISADIGAMAQLFFGYRSATKLKSQVRLWISNDSALATAEALFPSFDTLLGPLDVF